MNRITDRQVPACVTQRKQVAAMDWDACMEAHSQIQRKRSTKSDCGKFTIYPCDPTPFQRILEERMADLELAKRRSMIGSWDYCGIN